jgi:hypothetical protein
MADAEAVLAEALERFPDEIRVFLGPHVANNLSDFESALKTRIAELAPEKFYRLEEEADMGAPNGTAAGAPAMVVAEAPAWSGIQPEEPSAVVPAPVEDDSWMRRVASLFGSRARH